VLLFYKNMLKTAFHSKAGQVMIEYAIVAGALLLLAAIMGLLTGTFGEYGERLLEMIASDYP
jgi:hypothetical protein